MEQIFNITMQIFGFFIIIIVLVGFLIAIISYITNSIMKNYNDVEDDDTDNISDGYHTFGELYRYRMLYNAMAFNLLHEKGIKVEKSIRHSDGEICFGGGWFIVVADLPGIGQVSNHYENINWELFKVPAVYKPTIIYDGHTPNDVADRIDAFLRKN
jgi:hypothetical protein